MTYYKRNIDKKLLEWKDSQNAIRHVDVIPLYAMSNLCKPNVSMEMKVATP